MLDMNIDNNILTMKLNLSENQINLFNCYQSTISNYDTIVKYSFNSLSGKTFIGNKNICIFCGKDNSETTFNNIAHTIPESLGNKKLFSYNECDKCNSYFGENIERELANFLSIFCSFGFVKRKKKKPHTKYYYKNGEITTFNKDRLLRIDTESGKRIVNEIDSNKSQLKINNIKINHHMIMKAFSKIAFALMPIDEHIYFDKTRKWLFDKIYPNENYPVNSFAILGIVSKALNKNDISVVLLKRKMTTTNENYPYMIIGINFAQFTFFVPVQFSSNDNIDRNHLILCATPINDVTIDMENFTTFSFAVDKKDVNLDLSINMTYETREIVREI